MSYHLYFFTPDYQHHYRPDHLDSADCARLSKSPHLAEKPNWRTSRAGKHFIRTQHPTLQYCLSHKHDHSLIALAPEKPGVDLEALALRDYTGLMSHIGNPAEQQLLHDSPNPQRTFYQIWTLKEALIKAENLRFPTDMKRVGLTAQNQLRTTQTDNYLYLTLQLSDHFIASAVFPCGKHPNTATITLYSNIMLTPILLNSNYPQLHINQDTFR